jgi:hypothetical protein
MLELSGWSVGKIFYGACAKNPEGFKGRDLNREAIYENIAE